ncbi:MAG: hypothetical protein ACXVFQ_18210 [Solirubrobacteraceae bacterium]
MAEPDKQTRRTQILDWMKEHPVEVADSFQGMPQGDANADAPAVLEGIFSGVEKLWSAMKEAIPDVRLEDLIEVMFGDTEYWAKHPVERHQPPQE